MPRKKKTEASPKAQALASVLTDIEALFPGAMTYASSPELRVGRRPTGVLPIDAMLDGGLPRGRFIEVYGPYSTLKSYYAYSAIAEAQKRGETVALIDYEHSFDSEWGEQIGIDLDALLIARPETAEQGMTILDGLLKQGFDLIVWDSIAAAQPSQHRESAPGEDNQPGALARVMSKGLARVTASNKHNSTVLFINQTREKIGITFGSPVTTSGGKAMGFYAALRLSFVRTGKITEPVMKWDGESWVKAKKVIGYKVQATAEKSKVSKPYSDCHFVFDLATGTVDNVGWLIGQGLESGLIQRNKTGHTIIPDLMDKPIHGKDSFRQWVDENEEVVEWLTDEVLKTD